MSQTMKRDLEAHLHGVGEARYLPLPHTVVLGLGHKARHGKDWVAAHCKRMFEQPELRIEIVPFSAALKATCRAMFGMTTKDAPLLQVVGTDLFRKKDPEVWVRSLYWYLADTQPDVAIIPDVRFPNELAFIRQMGGYAVRVERLNQDNTPYVADDRDPNHPSETALDDYGFDGTITAYSGDLPLLTAAAEEMFEYFLKNYLHPQPEPPQTEPSVVHVPLIGFDPFDPGWSHARRGPDSAVPATPLRRAA